MSRDGRFVLFWHHNYQVSLNNFFPYNTFINVCILVCFKDRSLIMSHNEEMNILKKVNPYGNTQKINDPHYENALKVL